MLLTFPSRYWFTIDHKKYLALAHSRAGFPQDFSSPVVLERYYHRVLTPFAYWTITISGSAFQRILLGKLCLYTLSRINVCLQTQYPRNTPSTYGHTAFHRPPGPKAWQTNQLIRFKLLPFRSPLLWEWSTNLLWRIKAFMRHKKIRAYYFLFLWLLRCFSSPAYLLMSYVFRHGYLDLQSRWVSPFGYSRVKGCLGPHRDFSHPATSFLGFLCLGIHRLHLSVCATA